MIICPNCQNENRLGAIFCMSCGSKLAIDDVNVQNFEEVTGVIPKSKQDKAKKKRKLIVNIIELVFILLIAGGIFLVFQKQELPKISTSAVAFEKFLDKRDKLENAVKVNKDGTEEITEEEINSYVADMVTGIDYKGKIQLRGIFVDLLDDNQIKFYFETDIFSQRIVSSCVGKVSVGDEGLIFKPGGFFSARMGKLPYPMFLFQYQTKELLKKNEKLMDFLNSLSSVKISDEKAEVKVGK